MMFPAVERQAKEPVDYFGSLFLTLTIIPLGGWIVDNADWHWVFWVFLPFGIIAFIVWDQKHLLIQTQHSLFLAIYHVHEVKINHQQL